MFVEVFHVVDPVPIMEDPEVNKTEMTSTLKDLTV